MRKLHVGLTPSRNSGFRASPYPLQSGHIRLADFDLSKRVNTPSLPSLAWPSLFGFLFKVSRTAESVVC